MGEGELKVLQRGMIGAAGFALGVTFLVIAIRRSEPGQIWRALNSANLWMAIPLVISVAIVFWLRAVRWAVLLRPLRADTSRRDVYPAVMIGFASNNLLPPPLSDIVRMLIAGRQLKLSNTQVIATIVLERMFDIFTILFLFGVIFLLSPKPNVELIYVGYTVGAISFVLFLFSIAHVVWTDAFLNVFERVFSYLPKKLEIFLVRHLELGSSGMSALKHHRLVFLVMAQSIALWFMMGAGIYLSLLATGISVHPSASFVVLVFTFVGVIIPSAPGSVGTIQLAFTLALAPYAISAGEAVAASIFWHFLAYFYVVVIGVYYFVKLGYSIDKLGKDVKEQAASI